MLKILENWIVGLKICCCPALELFHCLPLWETEFFHRGRQQKSSRAGKQSLFSDLEFNFQSFQHQVLDFLLKKKKWPWVKKTTFMQQKLSTHAFLSSQKFCSWLFKPQKSEICDHGFYSYINSLISVRLWNFKNGGS